MPSVIIDFSSTTPNKYRVTFRMIDFRGEKRAWGFDLPTAPSSANLTALLGTYGAATNAYVYSVEVTEIYEETPSSSLALNAVYVSADSLIGVPYKVGSETVGRLELRAPLGAMVLSGERPDESNGELQALIGAFDNMLSAYATDLAVQPVWMRFTERKDRNSAVPIVNGY